MDYIEKNMVEMLQKEEGENNGLTKDINNMRWIINMSPPIQGTKTIDNLKRQMVLIEDENIKLFNKKVPHTGDTESLDQCG